MIQRAHIGCCLSAEALNIAQHTPLLLINRSISPLVCMYAWHTLAVHFADTAQSFYTADELILLLLFFIRILRFPSSVCRYAQ